MAKARIYKPTKTAMQSGKAKTKNWVLEYKPQAKKIVDNLMGWQGSTDMLQEIKLKFESKESAIEYAQKQNIEFDLIEPKISTIKIKSYADNFTS
jgi:hypothetical protein